MDPRTTDAWLGSLLDNVDSHKTKSILQEKHGSVVQHAMKYGIDARKVSARATKAQIIAAIKEVASSIQEKTRLGRLYKCIFRCLISLSYSVLHAKPTNPRRL